MRRKKVFTERKKINNTFHLNLKKVYRKFRATSEIEVKDAPTKDQIQKCWGDIWQRSKEHNKEAEWLPKLKEEYCSNATAKQYKITPNFFKEVIGKLQNNRAAGKDLVVPLWIKKIYALHQPIINIFEEMKSGKKKCLN